MTYRRISNLYNYTIYAVYTQNRYKENYVIDENSVVRWI